MRADGPVVIALDGSPHSEHTLEWGLHEASLRGADVVLARSWTDPRDLVEWSWYPLVDAELDAETTTYLSEKQAVAVDRYPDLTVTTSDESAYGGNGWLGVLGLAAWVWTILLVVTTPGPLRATRWAWFWLVGVLPPVGAITFLLLGGPTGLVPEREGTRRLTGGWAFLLAFALNSVLATLLGPVLGGGLRSLS